MGRCKEIFSFRAGCRYSAKGGVSRSSAKKKLWARERSSVTLREYAVKQRTIVRSIAREKGGGFTSGSRELLYLM